MPNHYTNVLLVVDGAVEGPGLAERLSGWADGGLFQRLMPVPEPILAAERANSSRVGVDILTEDGYSWRRKHWGTKWDAYQALRPVELHGDAPSVLLTFCTAWGPPSPQLREAIARELCQVYGAAAVAWSGVDPFDRSLHRLGDWTADDFACPPPRATGDTT